jgi:predicted ATPase
MRIALCGASGTGKTTLARWLVDKYGLELNPVGSRSVAKEMGFESPYDVDKAGKRAEFQERLILSKTRWEIDHDAFVTDRTTFDNLVYTMLHEVHSISADHFALAKAGVGRYTHVIFCPLSAVFVPGDDPVRVKDRTYHELFETALWGLIHREFAVSERPLFYASMSGEARYRLVNEFLQGGG